MISASVALLLTFSRNHLVTILVALLVAALFAARHLRAAARGIQMMATIGGAVLVLGIVAGTLSERFQSLLTEVSRTFWTRVVEGLDPSVVNVESSAEWRDIESELAFASMISRFWFGTGFGAPYRGYATGEVFSGSYGLTYLHNSFLWVPVKVGVPLAIALFIVVIALYVTVWVATTRSKGSIGRDALLVLLALSPAMYVAPTLFSTEGAPVLGGLVAISLFSMKAPAGKWWRVAESSGHSRYSYVGEYMPFNNPGVCDTRRSSGKTSERSGRI
jgi:hypothetical protein